MPNSSTVFEANRPASAVNTAYAGTLLGLTARTNSAAWKGFNAGELLYLGVQGCQDKGGSYKLTHAFKASPNRTALAVANGQITGVNKNGFQYIWVVYYPDVASGAQVMKAKAAFVHTVYEAGDFSLIGV